MDSLAYEIETEDFDKDISMMQIVNLIPAIFLKNILQE